MSRPNVLFVFADQLRLRSTSLGGSRQVRTPNLDRMAHQGTVFENTVSNVPVCTPWRAAFLTGQYPLTNGIFMNDLRLPTDRPTFGRPSSETQGMLQAISGSGISTAASGQPSRPRGPDARGSTSGLSATAPTTISSPSTIVTRPRCCTGTAMMLPRRRISRSITCAIGIRTAPSVS